MLQLPGNTSGYWDAGVFTGQERPISLWPDSSGFYEDLETNAGAGELPTFKPTGLAGGPAVAMSGSHAFAAVRRLWSRYENHTFIVLQLDGGEEAQVAKLLRNGSASGEGTQLQIRDGRLEIAAATKWNRNHYRLEGRRMIADGEPHLIHWWDRPDGFQSVMVDGEVDIEQPNTLEVQPYQDGPNLIRIWDRGVTTLASPGLLGMVLTVDGSATDEEIQRVYAWVGERWPGVAGAVDDPTWMWWLLAAAAAGGGYYYYRKQQQKKNKQTRVQA